MNKCKCLTQLVNLTHNRYMKKIEYLDIFGEIVLLYPLITTVLFSFRKNIK